METAEPLVTTSKSEQTRQKLLAAGIALFSTDGYDATSTRKVETSAGVQRNLISYHFGNKEAFWKACVSELFLRGRETLAPAFRQSKDVAPSERVRFLIRQLVRLGAAHPEIMRIMFDEGRRDDWRLEWLIERFTRDFYQQVADLYGEGRARGVIPELGATRFYYLLLSSGAIFAMAPECRRLSGEDPGEPAMVDAQAEAMAQLLAPAAREIRDE